MFGCSAMPRQVKNLIYAISSSHLHHVTSQFHKLSFYIIFKKNKWNACISVYLYNQCLYFCQGWTGQTQLIWCSAGSVTTSLVTAELSEANQSECGFLSWIRYFEFFFLQIMDLSNINLLHLTYLFEMKEIVMQQGLFKSIPPSIKLYY